MRPGKKPFLTDNDALRVRRVLFLNGMPAEEIDDAMQEIEVRALRRPPDRGSRMAWACTVATNLAMDRHRRMARQEPPHEDVTATAPPDAAAIALRDSVRAELERLTPEFRAAVVLRFYADLTVPEIAASLGLPEGTVKSRLHRGMAELRRTLASEVVR